MRRQSRANTQYHSGTAHSPHPKIELIALEKISQTTVARVRARRTRIASAATGSTRVPVGRRR
jgi:hypothetical protein